ncbi:MAG: DUF3108 domain-containing protein [Clostridium sp.]|nr:DUF3108 domain-containing protein [Clostridium sp.]
MKLLLRLLLAVVATAALVAGNAQAATSHDNLPDETLNYKVLFKWGLVNKTAGRVTLKMNRVDDNYRAILYARSEPWADKFYSLRDTLTSIMHRTTLVPRRYERIAHEGGKYVCDQIDFTQFKNEFSGECVRTRRDNETGELVSTTTSLQATGMTVDFISAFYYLRTMDFTAMLPGHAITINIFSGRRKELLRFSYRGIETLTVDGKKYNAYKVEFTFTSDGKKQTSDPVTAWVTTDERRIPLMVEGKLKVGKIRCVLTN